MLPLVALSLAAPTPATLKTVARSQELGALCAASLWRCQWRQQYAVEATSHIISFQKNSKTTTEIIIVVAGHECLWKVQQAASK
jgi:hypothetical protein